MIQPVYLSSDTSAFTESSAGNQALEPVPLPVIYSISISGLFSEEPSAGTSTTDVKRRREPEEPSAGTSNKKFRYSVKPLRVGKRPIFPVFIRKPCTKDFVKVKALMDSGATTLCLSDHCVNRFMIPKVQRDHPIQVTDVAG